MKNNCSKYQKNYNSFSDTDDAASKYALKARPVAPVSYCNRKTESKSRLTGHRKQIAVEKEKIKIKCERITRLKRAIRTLNRDIDAHRIESVEEIELNEFENLLDDGAMPQGMDDVLPLPRFPNVEVDEIYIQDENGVEHAVTEISNAISTGNDIVDVDEALSLQYGFTTDVS